MCIYICSNKSENLTIMYIPYIISMKYFKFKLHTYILDGRMYDICKKPYKSIGNLSDGQDEMIWNPIYMDA